MSGLKGAKTMSVGNGSADYFHVGELSANTITLGDDIKIKGDSTLLTIIRKLQEEMVELKKEVAELKSKIDSLEVE